MGTLTSLLHLSQQALEASQQAIDITSNNVANANTPGYTREIAVWQQSDTVQLSGSVVQSQAPGVTAVSQRDAVLNRRVQQQTQLASASSAESAALTDLQSVFSLSSTSSSVVSTTVGTSMDSFFSTLSSLEASPADPSARQAVVSAAVVLASAFNSASNQIEQQSQGLNQQVAGAVDVINTLISSIASLNMQIQSSSPNRDAGPLEDQRQQDLSQLSKYIGFDQVKTENNGLTLTTAAGTVLVSQGRSFALSQSPVQGNVHILSSTGKDITSLLAGGALGGTLWARDQDLPDVVSQLDTLAYSIGNAVNAQNTAGVDASGNQGGILFNIPPSAPGAARAISVALTDPNAIAAAGPGQGPSGNLNATALSALANANLIGGQTVAGFYASFLTRLGSNVSRTAEETTTQQASLSQLTTERSSQSSVSLDEEAANLSMYERSYNAAARIFTIVDQLMAAALNLGTQTAVS